MKKLNDNLQVRIIPKSKPYEPMARSVQSMLTYILARQPEMLTNILSALYHGNESSNSPTSTHYGRNK